MNIETVFLLVGTWFLKFLAGLLVLWVGLKLATWLKEIIRERMFRRAVDRTVAVFLSNIIVWALRIGVVIAAVQTAGIDVSGFAALLAGAGVAIGLALSGNLQNFAGGLVLLLFRPFRVGDIIKAKDYLGTVDEIQIFHTVVKTFDNATVFMPNGPLCGDTIENLSIEALRRCDFTFSIGYDDDIDTARSLILEIVRADARAIQDLPGKEPFIAVTELAENSVDFSVRIWTKATDLWPFRFDTLERVKKAFDATGITIPFPQREVHLREPKPKSAQPA